jgi:hypothetical protein
VSRSVVRRISSVVATLPTSKAAMPPSRRPRRPREPAADEGRSADVPAVRPSVRRGWRMIGATPLRIAPCRARRSESPSFDSQALLDGFGTGDEVAAQATDTYPSAGLGRRRVPYNKGTRRHQPKRHVRGHRRCVAVAAKRPSVAVTLTPAATPQPSAAPGPLGPARTDRAAIPTRERRLSPGSPRPAVRTPVDPAGRHRSCRHHRAPVAATQG